MTPTALRTFLRSVGQIVLQGNALTGLCIVAAWLICDRRLACCAATGVIAANVGAMLNGSDNAGDAASVDTQAGLHGFNGALAGLAAATFIVDMPTALAWSTIAGTVCGWIIGPCATWLGSRGLACLSMPAIGVTWFWLTISRNTPATSHPVSSAPTHAFDAHVWPHFVDATLAGIAQTVFAQGAMAGALVLAGIAFASPRAALSAFAGAALATFTAYAMTYAFESAMAFNTGTFGFNGALIALALSGHAWRWRVAAVLGGVALQCMAMHVAMHFALPTLTAPFVLAVWGVQRLLTIRTQLSAATRFKRFN